MISGSCLCGNVRYEISGPLSGITHCHCSQCRKTHGAAFASYADVKRGDFKFVSGERNVASFSSSPDVLRTFCKRCGSPLQFIRLSRPETLSIAVGTLDSDPGVRPVHHIFVGFKAPWYEITDNLPQYTERRSKSGHISERP
ncbi:MAG TPA: GFA family protein [Burkholderiales bacterium]|nr:GFA family protein [Burkholderiales bacterium]